MEIEPCEIPFARWGSVSDADVDFFCFVVKVSSADDFGSVDAEGVVSLSEGAAQSLCVLFCREGK